MFRSFPFIFLILLLGLATIPCLSAVAEAEVVTTNEKILGLQLSCLEKGKRLIPGIVRKTRWISWRKLFKNRIARLTELDRLKKAQKLSRKLKSKRYSRKLRKRCKMAQPEPTPSATITPIATPTGQPTSSPTGTPAQTPTTPPNGSLIYADNQLTDNCTGNYSIAGRNCSGNDGSAYNTIQAAINTMDLGDIVYLRGGTFYPSAQVRFNKDGAPGAFLEMRAYPGESIIVDGSNLPEGNTDHGSTPTLMFAGTEYWKVKGPIHTINGRGAGVMIDESENIKLELIESSYNGQTASYAAHGIGVWDSDNILLKNCDVHHNANHFWKTGEDQAYNQYQHGDGFRIYSGHQVRLEGCRSWNNLDDNYDLVGMPEGETGAVDLIDCHAAYAGTDDAAGSITKTANYKTPWGEGFKLGYEDDSENHRCIRCISWNNNKNGFHMGQGPRFIYQSISYANQGVAFKYYKTWNNLYQLGHYLQNSWELSNIKGTGHLPYEQNSNANSWDTDSTFSVSQDDLVSLDETGMLGQRLSNGSFPATDFLRLKQNSDLIDAGIQVTTTASSGSGTVLPVADSRYFYGDHPLEANSGAVIQLEGQAQTVRIASIDYGSNTLTLDTSLTWQAGQGVSFAYAGSAPDIGPFEYQSN